MTDEAAVHDLLEGAVREHRPAVVDPTRAVLARARRERRRATLNGLAVALVVVLGTGGVLGLVDRGSGDANPAAPQIDPPAVWPDGQPDDALGRGEAEEAAEAARLEALAQAALAAAEQAAVSGALSITGTASPAVRVPEGWRVVSGGSDSDLADLRCAGAPTVYRVSLETGGAAQPCLGEPATPYLWDGGGRSPQLAYMVDQVILPDGTAQWIQRLSGPAGTLVIDVYFPASGQQVRAAGVDLAAFQSLLQPGGSTANSQLLPPSTADLSLSLSTGSSSASQVPAEAAADVFAALRQLPLLDAASRGGCFGQHAGPSGHWQLEVHRGDTPVGFLVVDAPPQGCRAAASTFGGVGELSDELVRLLATFA